MSTPDNITNPYERRIKAIMLNGRLFSYPTERCDHQDIMDRILDELGGTPNGRAQLMRDIDEERIPIEFGYSWGEGHFTTCGTFTPAERKGWYITPQINRLKEGVEI